MATLTVYPSSGTGSSTSDARVYRQGVDEAFATIRNGNGTDVDATSANTVPVQIQCSTTVNQFKTLSRGVFSFDTSPLGSSSSIVSAILSFNGTSKANSLSSGEPTLLVAGVSMGNPAVPAASDYQAVLRTSFATGITYTNLSTTGYNDLALNSNGLANISLTGISQFSTQWDWDLNNSFLGTWTAGESQVYLFIDFADQGGTTTDPKLVITYTPPASSGIPVPPSAATRVQKRYYYKIYGSNQRYITTWSKEVISDPRFDMVLNGGAGQLIVKLARNYDSFGEGNDVSLNNRVELWVADSNNLSNNNNAGTLWDTAQWDIDLWDSPLYSFRKIYSGFISAYAPVLDNENQYVEVTLLGYASEASFNIMRNASGNTSITFSSTDVATAFSNVIDYYRADGGVNFIGGTFGNTGASISYTFTNNTYKEVFDKLVSCAPNGWYWFLDPSTNTINLATADLNGSPTHTLVIGKNISFLQTVKRNEDVVNRVLLIGGGATPLYNQYSRNGSIAANGKHEAKIQDGNVTNNTTADLLARRMLDQYQNPETRSVIRVVDDNGENSGQGYDIEKIKPGDTIQIKNLNYGSVSNSSWDTAVWDVDVWDSSLTYQAAAIMLIVKVSYTPDYIELEASSRLPALSKKIEQDITQKINTLYQQGLPVSPTIRSV